MQMPTIRLLSAAALVILATLPLGGHAADFSIADPIPAPPEEQRGIWGAIAYSPVDDRQGFFWGADKREEAGDNALKYCQNAKGKACRVVTVFRNHRHWNDDDGSGFPYEHCAALSVGKSLGDGKRPWAASSEKTRREAEDKAQALCGGSDKQCKVREWVCT